MSVYQYLSENTIVLECGLKYQIREIFESDKVHLFIWKPKAVNPCFNDLVSKDKFNEIVDKEKKDLISHQQIVKNRREKRKLSKENMEIINIGDIYYTCPDYTKENVIFYQVTSKKGFYVGFKMVEKEEFYKNNDIRIRPLIDKFISEEFFRKPIFSNEITFFIEHHLIGSLWG